MKISFATELFNVNFIRTCLLNFTEKKTCQKAHIEINSSHSTYLVSQSYCKYSLFES